MNAQHTPGPWRVESINYDGDGGILVRCNRNNSRNHCIANVWGAKNARDPDAEGQANARLISAAPELLEALEELRSAVIDLDQDEECSVTHCENLIRKARAAIAKAKGEV